MCRLDIQNILTLYSDRHFIIVISKKPKKFFLLKIDHKNELKFAEKSHNP